MRFTAIFEFSMLVATAAIVAAAPAPNPGRGNVSTL